MGSCVSSRNTMKVGDITTNNSETESDENKASTPSTTLPSIRCNVETNSQDIVNGNGDLNKISVYESPKKSSNMMSREFTPSPVSFIQEIDENNENNVTNNNLAAANNTIKIKVQNDNSSENSDDDNDYSRVLDDADFFWIPATLASHMGVYNHKNFLSERPRDRIYANDDELFMSVETSRRGSQLPKRTYSDIILTNRDHSDKVLTNCMASDISISPMSPLSPATMKNQMKTSQGYIRNLTTTLTNVHIENEKLEKSFSGETGFSISNLHQEDWMSLSR